jgi:extradiol dioxygenase family protein
MKPIEKLASLVNEAIEAREFVHNGTHHLRSIGNIDDQEVFFMFDKIGIAVNKKSFYLALNEWSGVRVEEN